MAAPTPGPSASRRPRESTQGDVDIGSFRRLEEIGKGSFATVYKAMHTVSTRSFSSRIVSHSFDGVMEASQQRVSSAFSDTFTNTDCGLEKRRLRSHQVGQSLLAQQEQEVEGEPFWRDSDPERSTPSSHRLPYRLSGEQLAYTLGDGILPAGGPFLFYQET